MASNCIQCGATLPVGAHECPFCHAPTPLGHAAQARALEDARAMEARAQYERQQALAVGRTQLDQQAQSSLLWSMGALVLCCVPGPQIMAIVRYVGARGTAQRLGLPLPGKATIALVVSITSIVVGISVVTWSIVRSEDLQKKADARVVELDRQLGAASSMATLDIGTACALAERHVLVEGHQGTKGHYFTGFDCSGKLTAGVDAAELEDFTFVKDSNAKKIRGSVCFKRGSKWYVGTIGAGRCAASSPVQPPASQGSVAATPPVGSTSPGSSGGTRGPRAVPAPKPSAVQRR